jgi:hypothetical protein
MSRGLGQVQRKILDFLRPWSRTARPTYTVHKLASLVSLNNHPTEAQLSAVRRAIRGLVAAGLVTEASPDLALRYFREGTAARRYESTEAPPKRRRTHTQRFF